MSWKNWCRRGTINIWLFDLKIQSYKNKKIIKDIGKKNVKTQYQTYI